MLWNEIDISKYFRPTKLNEAGGRLERVNEEGFQNRWPVLKGYPSIHLE
jgi:hypothetical protein